MIHAEQLPTIHSKPTHQLVNPLMSLDDGRLRHIADSVRAVGLHESADAIEMRRLTWGDGCTLVGTIKLLQLMASRHKREPWHSRTCLALALLCGATSELAWWSAAALSNDVVN